MNANEVFFQEYKDNMIAIMKFALDEIDFLKREHDDVFDRMLSNIPKESSPAIEQARFMSDDKLKLYRKRILDHGNDCIRRMQNEVNRTHIQFKIK